MDNFKNFGEALAWMMESPENVAIAEANNGCRYRWNEGEIHVMIPGTEIWQDVPEATIKYYAEATWSRTPREPLEFRADAYVAGSALELDHKRLAQFCNDANNGTKFELILKEKN